MLLQPATMVSKFYKGRGRGKGKSRRDAKGKEIENDEVPRTWFKKIFRVDKRLEELYRDYFFSQDILDEVRQELQHTDASITYMGI